MDFCEFCDEFKSFPDSRIGKIYGKEGLRSRIVDSTGNFAAIPTIGPIIPNSYLVLPFQHYETFARIPSSLYDESLQLINQVERKIGKKCILFEHGAQKCTNSGCGIYHAHIHIVPILSDFSHSEIVGEHALIGSNFADAMHTLSCAANYVLYRNNNGFFFFNEYGIDRQEIFTSQFFRKWLHKRFSSSKSWNWRDYNSVENDVMKALEISST